MLSSLMRPAQAGRNAKGGRGVCRTRPFCMANRHLSRTERRFPEEPA